MESFELSDVIDKLVDLLIPVILSVGSYLCVAVKKYASRMVKSFEAKNDLDSLKKINEMKSLILNEIGTIVDAAVGSNMQLADKMKANNDDHKLTDEQVNELNRVAKTLIMDALPDSLTDDNGSLLGIIGGEDRLNTIIDGMLEKYVYEYKIKSSENNKKQTSVTEDPKKPNTGQISIKRSAISPKSSTRYYK